MSTTPDEVFLEALVRVRGLVEAHPAALHGIVAALAADGRAFASTPEGRRWRELLERSELLPRARLLWDALGLGGAPPETADPVRPSELVRLLVEVARSPRLEVLLSMLPLASREAR